MNLGQIYETVLGWAGKKLGENLPHQFLMVLQLMKINELLDEAGVPAYGTVLTYTMVEQVNVLINQQQLV